MENRFVSFDFFVGEKPYRLTLGIDKILYFELYRGITRFYLLDGTILDVAHDYDLVKSIIDKSLKNENLV